MKISNKYIIFLSIMICMGQLQASWYTSILRLGSGLLNRKKTVLCIVGAAGISALWYCFKSMRDAKIDREQRSILWGRCRQLEEYARNLRTGNVLTSSEAPVLRFQGRTWGKPWNLTVQPVLRGNKAALLADLGNGRAKTVVLS